VRAVRFNHVSIHAYDLEESVRFYQELFGMERLPTPTFPNVVVEWLRLGDQQLHLMRRDVPAPEYHHIGLDVDDFEATYRAARERGVLDERSFGGVRQLIDGSVQMYLRDPAGNLVEIDWPDASTLDRSLFGEIRRLEDQVAQTGDARRARLYVTEPAAAR
jgi:lactoylglutathione lyase